MRKISLLGVLALSLLFFGHERADAWLNFKFGAGINWNWQSGGNNVFWGLFRNGQPPGSGGCDPSCIGGFGGGNAGCTPFNYGQQNCMPQQCSPWMSQPPCGPQGMNCPTFPNNGHYAPNEFQFFGRENDPAARNNSSSAYNGYYQNWASGYYPTSSSSSYYYPSYGAPNYNYPPSYWYPNWNWSSSSYSYPNYGYGSSSYYYPTTQSTSSYYYPQYPTTNPQSCYYNLYCNYNGR